jgi:putative hydrolase of the HAD superfamily
MTSANSISVILFDLGGVLVELGESPIPQRWLPTGEAHFDLQKWFHSSVAQEFESGLIDADEFAKNLRQELGLTVSTAMIIDQFRRWPLGLFAGVETLLQELRAHYRLAVLSNSNEVHWPILSQTLGLERLVEQMFSSHLLKSAKPSFNAFMQTLDELKVAPHEVLFFDDNHLNITAALELGMHARLVSGPQEIRSALRDAKLI